MLRKMALLCLCALWLAGCKPPLNINTVLKEPHFAGTVEEVRESSFLVRVADGEALRSSSDLVEVSLDVELKDTRVELMSGDELTIYYDGEVLESYPARIRRVYAVQLTSASKLGDWVDLGLVELTLWRDGSESRREINEKGEINGLFAWFKALKLKKLEEGRDFEEAERYDFTLHNLNSDGSEYGSTEFQVLLSPSGEGVLQYNGEWYEVLNPSNPLAN
ncbi:MAG: YobA family protein [Christensenellaceae bacterium]|jgi:hypothetical protein|nr:YobA family protein [Christensenellaceae bacterium]